MLHNIRAWCKSCPFGTQYLDLAQSASRRKRRVTRACDTGLRGATARRSAPGACGSARMNVRVRGVMRVPNFQLRLKSSTDHRMQQESKKRCKWQEPVTGHGHQSRQSMHECMAHVSYHTRFQSYIYNTAVYVSHNIARDRRKYRTISNDLHDRSRQTQLP